MQNQSVAILYHRQTALLSVSVTRCKPKATHEAKAHIGEGLQFTTIPKVQEPCQTILPTSLYRKREATLKKHYACEKFGQYKGKRIEGTLIIM